MVLFEDVRNKVGKHENIHHYMEKRGIEIIRQALCVGDYVIANDHSIAVDTKMDVKELAMDIFQDHRRFREECERAQRCGIQLIVLVEEALPGGRLDHWRSPQDRNGNPICLFDPKTLRKAMITMQEKYGVRFRFCDGRSTGKLLLEYLEGKRK